MVLDPERAHTGLALVHSVQTPVSSAPPEPVERALCHLSDEELERFRGSLASALAGLELGTPASRLIGQLCRRARTEQRRRRHSRSGPRAAA